MRTQNDRILHLVSAVGDLDSRRVEEGVAGLLAQGMKAEEIRKSLDVGMKLVGEYFRSGEYFLADLLYAGRMYRGILELEGMKAKGGRESTRRAVAGTAPGDDHDLLKDILACTLRSGGFAVLDLGTSPTEAAFLAAVAEQAPRVVAIGCKRRQAPEALGSLISSIRGHAPEASRIVLCGPGAPVDGYRALGADSVCRDAMDGVELCMSYL